MGLFGKKEDDTKYVELEEQYRIIQNNQLDRDERIELMNRFEDLCSRFSENDIQGFIKYAQKHSKKERGGIYDFSHPLFGSFTKSTNIFGRIRYSVINEKDRLVKAKRVEQEFLAIKETEPRINKEYVLERKRMADIPEIKVQNITKSFDLQTKLPSFIVLDLETTGLSPGKDRIVQLSALRYDDGKPEECLSCLVDPARDIPEDATRVNGITNDDVKGAPLLSDIAESLIDFVGNSPIVGYNVSFDLNFLFCSGIDLITKRKIYDAKALAKKLYKGDIDYYSLENVLHYNGIYIKELHDSKVDCFATGLVFLKMIDEITY